MPLAAFAASPTLASPKSKTASNGDATAALFQPTFGATTKRKTSSGHNTIAPLITRIIGPCFGPFTAPLKASEGYPCSAGWPSSSSIVIRARTSEGRERAKARASTSAAKPKLIVHQRREAIRRRDELGETLTPSRPRPRSGVDLARSVTPRGARGRPIRKRKIDLGSVRRP
jgi:hypothetical protein